MDSTLLKIAAAALLHDVGKFADPSALEVSEQFIRNHADLYQPFDRHIRRHTHVHALYTAAFLEKLHDLMPPEFYCRDWGDGEPLVNLAAGHHRPEDSPLRWIITEADCLSSGWERRAGETNKGEAAVTPAEYQKIRLGAILGELSLPEQNDCSRTIPHFSPRLGYPLQELSPQSIFPKSVEEVTPADRGEAEAEYRRLFARFKENLEVLAHRRESLELWLEHFDSLLLTFTALIPAQRAGTVEAGRDVSLYDHARTTAALATALYAYHQHEGSLTVAAIRDRSAKKLLFVNGDFYGIQDFIFSSGGEIRRYRAKLLRGRSFTVSLLSELAADLVCRRLGLPFLSVVLNAAGKFTVLAPNTEAAWQAVSAAETCLNDWLFNISLGESALGLATQEASPEDLLAGKLLDLWESIGQKMERRKLHRLDLKRQGGIIPGYLEGFRSDLDRPFCPLCGKRPSTLPGGENGQDPYLRAVPSACAPCRDQIFLGSNLVKKNRLAVTNLQAEFKNPDNCLREPLFGCYQVAFVDGLMNEEARQGNLLRLWDISPPGESLVSPVTRKLINGYVPICQEKDLNDPRIGKLQSLGEDEEANVGDPKPLNHLAVLSLKPVEIEGKFIFEGLEALGVLKADVDHLGLLLTCGLPEAKFTLSRLATLSRQLHFFFCLYLPHLLATRSEFQNTYTVFAGGDDLLLLGPWNRLTALARVIQEKFTAYVGKNPVLHLSAGLTLTKAHTPVDQMAKAVEAALKQAKTAGRCRLTQFGETVPWDSVGELDQVRFTLQEWLDKEWFTVAMLYRLNDFIRMAAEEKQFLSGGQVHLKDMACLKWRAYLAYFTGRNVARHLHGGARDAAVTQIHEKLVQWLTNYGSTLRIPLWELLYDRRRK